MPSVVSFFLYVLFVFCFCARAIKNTQLQ